MNSTSGTTAGQRKHLHWPGNTDDAVEISKNMLLDPDVDFDEDLRDRVWDVIIIGAGVVGGAIARQLSRYSLSILALEKSADVAQGASKANSGIVHGGFDEEHGTLKSKVCYKGNRMFKNLDSELHFGFREVGALVIAFKNTASNPAEAQAANEASLQELKRLYANGKKNGVEKLEIIGKERVLELEPHINPDVLSALYCPTVGITSPYEFCIALFENAVHNGVTLLLEHEVTDIQRSYVEPELRSPLKPTFSQDLAQAMRELNIPFNPKRREVIEETISQSQSAAHQDGDSILPGSIFSQNADHEGFVVHTNRDEGAEYGFRCKVVINCAGLASGDIARMVGEPGFRIEPRKGEAAAVLDFVHGACVIFNPPASPGTSIIRGVYPSRSEPGGSRELRFVPVARQAFGQGYSRFTDLPREPPPGANKSRDVRTAIEQGGVKNDIEECSENNTCLANLRSHFDPSEAITSYTGLRAKSSTKDFIVAPHPNCANFVNVAGIDSPGLTASPAIALLVEEVLRTNCGDVLGVESWKRKDKWDRERRAIINKKSDDWDGKVDDKRGPQWNIICRCERVSESEIVDA
ncbi:hypothetical protein HDU93_005138 [Gonapodya sp. JEL0774]|nr:hypothetical protein HDU93_005138 [Gonapodya sp. JEL0774]